MGKLGIMGNLSRLQSTQYTQYTQNTQSPLTTKNYQLKTKKMPKQLIDSAFLRIFESQTTSDTLYELFD